MLAPATSDLALVRSRFSCRSYAARSLRDADRHSLEELCADERSGPFGAPLRFALVAAGDEERGALKGLGTYGFIKGARAFVVGAIVEGPSHARGLEDFGFAMERLVLGATALGLGTCWLGGTFTKSGFAKKIGAREGETVPAVFSVGYMENEEAARDALMRRRVGAHSRLPWDTLFFDENFDRPLSREAAGLHAEALEAVRIGPSASNKQPWRIVRAGGSYHFYLRRTPGYRQQAVMKIMKIADIQRIDLGIAMCHFDLAARELGFRGAWRVQDPSIAPPEPAFEYTATWVPATS